MSAPTKLPVWADAPTDPVPGLPGTVHPIAEPLDAVKHQGWVGERPPLNVFNWWMNLVYQWVAWFDTTISATHLMAVPIGGIIPWHKAMANVPALPANYHECDGSVISEPLSPMNGKTLPNINGLGQFIRGSATSGTVQSSQNKSATLSGTVQRQSKIQGYNNATPEDVIYGSSIAPYGSGSYGYVFKRELTDGSLDSTIQDLQVNTGNAAVSVDIPAGTPDESRPDNISMCFIMRIY